MKDYAKRVEELHVYQRAYKISLEIHKLSLNFPKIEQYALADQLLVHQCRFRVRSYAGAISWKS